MTVVTAALAWFDEAPEDLDKFVRALPIAVDRLIAVDGGYERYPGAKPKSPSAEAAAIKAAAKDVGLPVKVVLPDHVWAGQVEKRNFVTRLAAEGSDWIFTLDADHILHGVHEAFRQEIVRVRADRIEVNFFTTVNPSRPMAETSSTSWHSDLAGKTVKMGLLVRALPGIQYERFHWWISAKKGMRRVWLYGGDDSYPHVKGHDLKAPLFIEHRCHFRRDRNIIANRDFCEDRVAIVKKTGQEDVVTA